ncbi:MAG: N-formylglutamate amidohydrolase [Alphaproteobacteria bacterium]|nr:N-formylglutamate amidohydrolase [Alphaproteobacteria bacterium]
MVWLVPGVLARFNPLADETPVLVDVSRSGREYPTDFRSPLPFSVLHDNVSMYVDELVADAPGAGATLLQALFPNTYIDTNRSESDLDPQLILEPWPGPIESTMSKSGLGLLKSKSRYGEPLQERKLTVAEVTERLEKYYRPYHAELARLVDRLHRKHGIVYQLSCHCMSAIGAPTHKDPGQERPDFCISGVRGTTASSAFLELVQSSLASYGYDVKIDIPYIGGELNTRYGAPGKGIESIMIEINKRLFMDVATFKKTAGFAQVKAAMTALVRTLAQHAQARTGPAPSVSSGA